MGLVAGDHVRAAYLTEDGTQNTFREFFLTAEGIGDHGEEQRVSIPTTLLQQANIPEHSDIQVFCLEGALVFAREEGLDQLELTEVLTSLQAASDVLAGLPDDPAGALEALERVGEQLLEGDELS